jgi:nucleoside-diphosphate-sugar epimerase
MSKVALVAGATGASAKRLVETLVAADWRVVGVSRNPPPSAGRITYVAANLADTDHLAAALKPHTDISHVFYTARAAHGESGVESVEDNFALLRNTVDVATRTATQLRHIHLVEGTKWYGMHLGPFATPAREDQPRHLPPNFYYDQQDYLSANARRARRGRGRPHARTSCAISHPSGRVMRPPWSVPTLASAVS